MSNTTLYGLPGQQYDAIVHPARAPLSGRITAQPSKNYTTRYLLAAALAAGESIVRNCATSADSEALQRCLYQMGAELEPLSDSSTPTAESFRIIGTAGNLALRDAQPVNPGNAGAVLRFLLGVGAKLPRVTFVTDHNESLGRRPNGELLNALQQLGCTSDSNSGLLPITLHGGKLYGGDVTISGARSSQFLSGLLFLAPLVGEPVHIRVTDGLVSKAPVRQTLEVINATGVDVSVSDDLMSYTVNPGLYKNGEYNVNGDWPGSAALLSAAAVTGGSIQIAELFDDQQGEKSSAAVLAEMGAEFYYEPGGNGIQFRGGSSLKGINFDGDLATDAVLALIGAACFASGRTRFYNISNLRIKECDRITEPLLELRKLGVSCWEGHEIEDPDPDAIVIEGNPAGYEGGVTVDGRNDHRVIMLLSIVALRCKNPVRISRAHEVSKSYPAYFSHLSALGGQVTFAEVSS